MPTYVGSRTKEGGKEPYSWTINAIWESECPASSITQKSFELVRIVNILQGAKELTGSTLGAGDMPGFILDAIRIAESENSVSEAARDEAVNR